MSTWASHIPVAVHNGTDDGSGSPWDHSVSQGSQATSGRGHLPSEGPAGEQGAYRSIPSEVSYDKVLQQFFAPDIHEHSRAHGAIPGVEQKSRCPATPTSGRVDGADHRGESQQGDRKATHLQHSAVRRRWGRVKTPRRSARACSLCASRLRLEEKSGCGRHRP
jgi:hypothetical protein